MAEVSFGEWLKRRRGAEGWTQERLAQLIHCSTSALRKFESEERRPSAEVVEQLANIFNIPQEEHKSFLRFTRGDWDAMAASNTADSPWRVSNLEPQSNLPSLITSFIGREKEQAEVINLLKMNRLVTLAGPGGIGKTRLAIQVGQELLHDYPDGVWFVPLDSLSEPLLIPQTVASVFDIREGADRPVMETLKNVLRRKTLLLILDNCEHLLDACVLLMESLLSHCPNLRILATSRETLNMEGEAICTLPSLSIPGESISVEELTEYEAVQLFLERASLALSKFQLTKENAPAIIDICRFVDGIPLAIELTAARVNILNIDEISKQLHKSFTTLASDRRTTISRHQTLQASLDWSWFLLTDSEQVFLRQLSVFAGGWTLEAAEAVCDGNTLHLTTSLIQKSLIKVRQEREHETRYYFHEMVRQYAREQLINREGDRSIHNKHLAYFVKLVEQAEPELFHSNQVIWFNKLDNERDNLRLALEWALSTDVESGLRIASIPWRFWQRHDPREWGNWLHKLLEHYPKGDSLRAQALAVSSAYFFAEGNMIEARKVAEQALQLARDLSDLQNEALSLLFLGRSIAFPGGYHEGIPFLEQSLALYRTLEDKIGQAMATGWMCIDHNNLDRSKSLLLQSLQLHRDLGNLSGIAYCLAFLGYNAIIRGDFSSPGPWLEEARTLNHQLEDLINEADALETLGILADRQGNYQQAYTYFEQAIMLYDKTGGYWASWPRVRMGHALLREGNIARAREIFEIIIQEFQKDGPLIGVVYTIEGLASLHANQGGHERTVRLIGCTDATREELGNHRPPIEQADVDKEVTACLAKMGEIAFSDAYEEGRKMSLEEAIWDALEES